MHSLLCGAMHVASRIIAEAVSNFWIALGVIAELLVALVIYFEFQADLTYHALETIYSPHVYKGRQELYVLFYSAAGTDEELSTRQENFKAKVLAETDHLKACDEQIAQFTKLGYLLRPRWLRRWMFWTKGFRKWSGYGPDDMIEFLPHVIAPLGVMLLPYIKQRRSEKGRYYAKHFLGLAIACVRKLEDRQITLYGSDRSQELTITSEDLTNARKELEKLWSFDQHR